MKIYWNCTSRFDDYDFFTCESYPNNALIHEFSGNNKGWYMVKLDNEGLQLSGMIDIFKTAKTCLTDFYNNN
jgi:hypothetical protein